MRTEYCFDTFDGKKLGCIRFLPDICKEDDRLPAVVIAFGGGWMNGTPEQFAPQGAALAQAGYQVFLPDYRVYDRDHVCIRTSLEDFFAFLLRMSSSAEMLQVDTNNVIIAGASAGGHLALCASMLCSLPFTFRVKGMFLFNPVVDTTSEGFQSPASLEQPFDPIIYSPMHHVGKPQPPVLIMAGTEDRTIPFSLQQKFAEKSRAAGNDVELVGYPGRDHGFFNLGNGRLREDYDDTLQRCLCFCKRVFGQ